MVLISEDQWPIAPDVQGPGQDQDNWGQQGPETLGGTGRLRCLASSQDAGLGKGHRPYGQEPEG